MGAGGLYVDEIMLSAAKATEGGRGPSGLLVGFEHVPRHMVTKSSTRSTIRGFSPIMFLCVSHICFSFVSCRLLIVAWFTCCPQMDRLCPSAVREYVPYSTNKKNQTEAVSRSTQLEAKQRAREDFQERLYSSY